MTPTPEMQALEALMTPILRNLIFWTCIAVTAMTYHAMGRRIHARPSWVLGLGILFMGSAVLLYAYTPPGAHGPIDVSIAALGGNLVATAFLMRASREHRDYRHELTREIARSEHMLAALNQRYNEIANDHHDAVAINAHASRLAVEIDEHKRKLERAEGEA